MNYKIAVITPIKKQDYLCDTIIDGLITLQQGNPELSFRFSSDYPCRTNNIKDKILDKDDFTSFAKSADLIFLVWGKKNTNTKLAQKIGQWKKIVFIDGSEVGKNNRYDFEIQKKLVTGDYDELGKVDKEMIEKCSLYFKREKPYLYGVTPFPFGIESKYLEYYEKGVTKDIDFVCIFGQDEYPLMRRYVRELLVDFCEKNNFTYRVERTESPGQFYNLLSKSKVGVSVGGGGYDTARFWEILGNNCLLLTESIDIYHSSSDNLNYERIWEFDNLHDFQDQLRKMAYFLRNEYDKLDLEIEYNDILSKHSSKARVLEILSRAKDAGMVK